MKKKNFKEKKKIKEKTRTAAIAFCFGFCWYMCILYWILGCWFCFGGASVQFRQLEFIGVYSREAEAVRRATCERQWKRSSGRRVWWLFVCEEAIGGVIVMEGMGKATNVLMLKATVYSDGYGS